eukprot:3524256-Prymnesium_polylepis.1
MEVAQEREVRLVWVPLIQRRPSRTDDVHQGTDDDERTAGAEYPKSPPAPHLRSAVGLLQGYWKLLEPRDALEVLRRAGGRERQRFPRRRVEKVIKIVIVKAGGAALTAR